MAIVEIIKDSKGHSHKVHDLWDVNRPRWSFSNDKTGIPGLNTLAGNKSHLYDGCIPGCLKGSFTGVCGTCSHDCPGCYAKKITRNIEPFIKYALNTIEVQSDPEKFMFLAERELYANPVVSYKVARFHDSGDFVGEDHFREACKMADRHKAETRFGCYSKENSIIEPNISMIPENMVVNCSPWKGVCEPISNLPQFIWDDGTDPELVKLPHCPAVSKEGKRTGVQCCNCLHCYKAKPGDRWAVYKH